ncbi:MAG: ChuX/HutX family heme-like substrate-binding protein [Pseudomonadota bacterium]
MPQHSQLLDDFNALRTQNPIMRSVDAALRLGVSEGELAEARAGEGEIVRLGGRGEELSRLVEGLRSVGPVMTLTRNGAVVHETKGPVRDVKFHGAMGQVVGPIDLRLFLRNWHVAYHVTEETKSGLRRSFQIFDAHGGSVLKVYALDDTDALAWQNLFEDTADGSGATATFTPREAKPADRPDDQIHVDEMCTRWRALEHSHDFFRILKDFAVGRQQALRLAGPELAEPLDPTAVHAMLRAVSDAEIPIMCFVGNPGCIQIFSGAVKTIGDAGTWLNVLDAEFNLHMRTDMIDRIWLVRKPTGLRGMITSLELFDAEGEMVCQFFGARPPGEPEREDWRDVAESLTKETVA